MKSRFTNQAPLPNRVKQTEDGKWEPLGNANLKQEDSAFVGALYDSGKKQFWITDTEGYWIEVNETQTKNYLKRDKSDLVREVKEDIIKGLQSAGEEVQDVDPSAPINRMMNFITRTANVIFATPLAGHSAGVYKYEDRRILVTSSPQIIKPVEGEWNTIKVLLREMFGEDQIRYFLGWLKLAHQSLASGEFTPGQMVVLVGRADCGKSMLQNLLITPIFGGRTGKPYQYMTGQTQFNFDLFKGEHLIIADEMPATEYRERVAFGAAIKNLVAEPMQRLHAKGKDAIMLKPFWRVSMSLNDDDESLMVLPPITDAIRDKLMVFQVERPSNLPSNAGDERKRFAEAIHRELPAFIHFLVNQYTIHPDIQKGRFGIAEYYNPDIALSVEDISPEAELMSLIGQSILSDASLSDEWEGSAGDLYAQVSGISSGVSVQFEKLVRSPKSLGKMLRHLEISSGTYKGSVRSYRSNGRRLFSINKKFKNGDRE